VGRRRCQSYDDEAPYTLHVLARKAVVEPYADF
jgi:hypothetical protein